MVTHPNGLLQLLGHLLVAGEVSCGNIEPFLGLPSAGLVPVRDYAAIPAMWIARLLFTSTCDIATELMRHQLQHWGRFAGCRNEMLPVDSAPSEGFITVLQ
jgi:hypothetical protein